MLVRALARLILACLGLLPLAELTTLATANNHRLIRSRTDIVNLTKHQRAAVPNKTEVPCHVDRAWTKTINLVSLAHSRSRCRSEAPAPILRSCRSTLPKHG